MTVGQPLPAGEQITVRPRLPVNLQAGRVERRRKFSTRQGSEVMATSKQTRAAKRNVQKAQEAAAGKKTIAHLPADKRTALGKQGAAVAKRKRSGGTSPKTRAELYEMARKRDLPGRSKMGRDELARKLGES
jgi:hypothetical protein